MPSRTSSARPSALFAAGVIAAAVIAAGAFAAGPLAAQQQQVVPPPGRQPSAEPENQLPAEGVERKASPVAPATRPSAKELPKLFADLANADPAVRENARVGLMGISRLDLSDFEKLVRDNLPLVPAQAAVLREVVTHVYLSGEEYPAVEGMGFLGVRMMVVSIVSSQEGHGANALVEDNPFDPRRPLTSGAPTTGVLILERMPGFPGARSMLDGDVVLGVVELPDQPIRNDTEMKDAVTSFKAGDTIHFRLLRQGQVIQVPITLDPLPEAAVPPIGGTNSMQILIDSRKARAMEYWEQRFAPMVKEAAG